MFKVIIAAVAASVLVSCGGGGESQSTLSASASSAALAQDIAPGHAALVADPVSVVNTTTAGSHSLNTVGATPDGGYIVAWTSSAEPALFIQAYDSTGAKAGAETQIPLNIVAPTPEAATAAILRSSVAVLSDGSVVVVYLVTRNIDLPGGGVQTTTGLYFQRFDANGNQLMGETPITSQPFQGPKGPFIQFPQIAPLSDGGFVVGWGIAHFSAQFGSISTLYLRWFDSQGQPVGYLWEVGDFPALTYRIIPDTQGGGFTLLTSQTDNFFRTEYSAFHYDASHAFLQVVAPQLDAVFVLRLEAGFVVFSRTAAGATAQMLDSQGNPVGAATSIPSLPFDARELADGTYVTISFASGDFVAQRYAAGGEAMGDPVPIDSAGVGPQIVPLADGGFAAAWTAASVSGGIDVYTQRFTERFSDRMKACQDRAKGLTGLERKTFIEACTA
jgi:hypothetical protein